MRRLLVYLLLVVSGYTVRAAGPVAKNDSVTMQENSHANINLAAYITDTNGGTLTVTISFPPANGSAVVSGENVFYVPMQGFFGRDSFQYQVTDSLGLNAMAYVYIFVKGTNLPPIVNNASYTFSDTVTTVVFNVLANDTDPGNDTLYVLSVSNIDTTIDLGYISIDSSTHQVVFTHTILTCGTETFQYTACNIAKCDSALITINVTCPDSVFLPQGFSPNGDGKNDFLVFPGLVRPSTLNVFNRYGTSVYQSTDYINNWNGTDLDTNKPLPDGTYFYVLTLPSGKSYNNFVVINR